MKEIILKATFGDEEKEVIITQVIAGGVTYKVYMDNYYQGCIHEMSTGWRFGEQKPGIFTYEDMQIMIDIIREWHEKNF